MNLQLILIVILVVFLNSLLLFFLFWYFFRREPVRTERGLSVARRDEALPRLYGIRGRLYGLFSRRLFYKILKIIFLVFCFFGIIWLLFLRGNKNENAIFNLKNSQESEIYHSPQKNYPRGLNLVFFADGYSSWEEFDDDVVNLMVGIKQIEPWKSYNTFNIYKINPGAETKICQIKTENERKPVLRCDENINTYLGKLNLERFKLVVLSRQDFQSWANVSRIENSGIFFSLKDKINQGNGLPISYLFAHLLGHSFGLKDEEKFIIAKAEGVPHNPDGPNCAPDVETAKKWWGNLAEKYPERVGYFKTCAGSDDFIRPTKSSLMNFGDMSDFVADYGPVSEEYLRKVLNYCFSEKVADSAKDPDFFERYPEMKECL